MKRLLIILMLALPVAAFGQLDTINVGTSANSGTGESLRSAMLKTNTVTKRLNTLGLHNVTQQLSQVNYLSGVTGAEVMTTESLTEAVIITVGDTTVTAVVGKIVYKTSD